MRAAVHMTMLMLLTAGGAIADSCPPGMVACAGIGNQCGDNSCCTGMNTVCGTRSLCSGMDTTCGPSSTCTGMGSRCGPGSACTGLGAQCDNSGGSAPAPVPASPPTMPTFAPMPPMPPMSPPMPPMPPMSPVPAATNVYNHGCDEGATCQGRSGISQTSGYTFCCDESCGHCSVSSSQVGSVLTVTCLCSAALSDASMPPMAPMPAMAPMHTMAPMPAMGPMPTMAPMLAMATLPVMRQPTDSFGRTMSSGGYDMGKSRKGSSVSDLAASVVLVLAVAFVAAGWARRGCQPQRMVHPPQGLLG